DLVHREQKRMLFFIELEEPRTDERGLPQIQRTASLGSGGAVHRLPALLCRQLPCFDRRESSDRLVSVDVNRLAILFSDPGPEDRMSRKKSLPSSVECWFVNRTAQVDNSLKCVIRV